MNDEDALTPREGDKMDPRELAEFVETMCLQGKRVSFWIDRKTKERCIEVDEVVA